MAFKEARNHSSIHNRSRICGCNCCCYHALQIKKLKTDLHMKQQDSTHIFVDNQAASSTASNPVFHGKTIHFKIKALLSKGEAQREGEMKLIYCKT